MEIVTVSCFHCLTSRMSVICFCLICPYIHSEPSLLQTGHTTRYVTPGEVEMQKTISITAAKYFIDTPEKPPPESVMETARYSLFYILNGDSIFLASLICFLVSLSETTCWFLLEHFAPSSTTDSLNRTRTRTHTHTHTLTSSSALLWTQRRPCELEKVEGKLSLLLLHLQALL